MYGNYSTNIFTIVRKALVKSLFFFIILIPINLVTGQGRGVINSSFNTFHIKYIVFLNYLDLFNTLMALPADGRVARMLKDLDQVIF